jgi:hypothetical protein
MASGDKIQWTREHKTAQGEANLETKGIQVELQAMELLLRPMLALFIKPEDIQTSITIKIISKKVYSLGKQITMQKKIILTLSRYFL